MPKIELTPETPMEAPLAPAGKALEFEVKEIVEETSKKTGEEIPARLKCTFVIIAPGEAYDGDNVFEYVNEWRTDPRAKVELNRLVRAVGLPSGPTDTEQLIGRKGKLVLKVKPAKGEYAEGRALKDFVVA